jgi:hypothetical protein
MSSLSPYYTLLTTLTTIDTDDEYEYELIQRLNKRRKNITVKNKNKNDEREENSSNGSADDSREARNRIDDDESMNRRHMNNSSRNNEEQQNEDGDKGSENPEHEDEDEEQKQTPRKRKQRNYVTTLKRQRYSRAIGLQMDRWPVKDTIYDELQWPLCGFISDEDEALTLEDDPDHNVSSTTSTGISNEGQSITESIQACTPLADNHFDDQKFIQPPTSPFPELLTHSQFSFHRDPIISTIRQCFAYIRAQQSKEQLKTSPLKLPTNVENEIGCHIGKMLQTLIGKMSIECAEAQMNSFGTAKHSPLLPLATAVDMQLSSTIIKKTAVRMGKLYPSKIENLQEIVRSCPDSDQHESSDESDET